MSKNGNNSSLAQAGELAQILEKAEIVEHELDGAGRRIYDLLRGPYPKPGDLTVDVQDLEDLAAEHNVPHFRIEGVAVRNTLGIEDIKKDWTIHIIHLPGIGPVFAWGHRKEAQPEEKFDPAKTLVKAISPGGLHELLDRELK